MALGLDAAIARQLDRDGHGTFDETGGTGDIFILEMLPSPDSAILVVDLPGGRMPDEFSEEHLVQITVRDPDPESGQARLRAVQDSLHGKGDVAGGSNAQGLIGDGTVGGSVLCAFVRATAPGARIDRDEGPTGGRWRFAQTYRVLTKVGFDLIT